MNAKTRRDLAIISAYTGILCGDFGDLQKYLEEKLKGHPLQFTPDQIREKVRDDFEAILVH